jgi:hypothetical protein
MNLYSDIEPAIVALTTFLSDSPVPSDQSGDEDTNAGRAERYDRVLPSFSLTNLLVSASDALADLQQWIGVRFTSLHAVVRGFPSPIWRFRRLEHAAHGGCEGSETFPIP